MTIFSFRDEESLGSVVTVDTGQVVVRVRDVERLRKLQVNRLAVLQSSRPGQHLVGIIQRIQRSTLDAAQVALASEPEPEQPHSTESNLVRISLIGTLLDRDGTRNNVFRRTLETVPEIEANCFCVEDDRLSKFMEVISEVQMDGPRLHLGNFTLDANAAAYLNGNRLFQRHAIVVGSTGSGKSWTTARLLEQIATLPQANAILFDVHGEYGPLHGNGIRKLRIAGPGDLGSDRGLSNGVLYLPYWLLGYEALVSMLVDRSDQNAPNQAMVMSRAITNAKRKKLEDAEQGDILANFTVDSPVPFSLGDVLEELDVLNREMVPGSKAGSEKQGDYHGKLSRLLARVEAKKADRRLGFMFQPPSASMEMAWLEQLASLLMCGTEHQSDKIGGVKIIDFSDVPSDVLPLMVSLVARICLTTQQWTPTAKRHPISLLCDEAHLYIPESASSEGAEEISVQTFERIAKEGRKYGVGLVVISQRPSEVNRTVLSQCNNIIAMRLTNGEDQAVIKRLLPDSLGGFGELLPILDTGEALVVGDASLLPTRVRIAEPSMKPDSGTLPFWDRWSARQEVAQTSAEAIRAWRKQSF